MLLIIQKLALGLRQSRQNSYSLSGRSLFFLSFFFSPFLFSLPSGMQVVEGEAKSRLEGSALSVETVGNTFLDWDQFSSAQGEIIRFLQMNGDFTVLNRVTGSQSSILNGALFSNGRIYLINPNGILIGPSGVVDTAGFLVSTLAISENSFSDQKELLLSAQGEGSLIHSGTIRCSKGDVFLFGRTIKNRGAI